ncbi:MAG: RDD family protein, partial [Frankia sp.]|nr:RDD family protein [Frankia sp.]
MSAIVTGEAVAVDLRVARLGSRMLAAVIDIAIQFALLFVGSGILGSALSEMDPTFAGAIALVLGVLLVVGYPVAQETLWRGQTIGKAALGLRVVRDDGGPATFWHVLVRGLLGAFVERPGITFGFAAIVCSLASRRGKRLGDLLAGTVVLQERVPRSHAVARAMPPQLASWATSLDLTRLPDDLALAAWQFAARARQMHPAAREQLGHV